MNPLKIAVIGAFLSCGASFSHAAATNIIDITYGIGAGSFELGAYIKNSGNQWNYMRLPANSTTIRGWTVGGADGVDWVTSPGSIASDGSYTMDLAGPSFVDRPTDGSISTRIPTVIGIQYLVSFSAYGGDEAHTGRLIAGNLSQLFTAPGNSNPNIALYSDFEFSFTAVNTFTAVTFSTTPDSFGFGPVIDNVIVTVPEPSTSVLGGFFVVGLAWIRKR